MGEFLVRRILQSLVALVGLLVLAFFLGRLTGDPSRLYLPESATQEMVEAFRRAHGYDQPIYVQFLDYVQDILRLDFGTSLRRDASAIDVVLRAYPYTLQLAGVTMVFSLLVAMTLGPLSAYWQGTWFDRAVNVFTLAAASAPDFWVAIIAILVLALHLGWLPTSGTGGVAYWVMPVMVLMFNITGIITQVVRGAMLSTLAQPYIKSARAKGMSEQRVVFIHALRNSLIAAITVAGDQTRSLINGAVVIETVFGWPGIGKLMIDSVMQRDFAVVQAAVMVTAALIFLLNILLDIAYAFLDPRIRLQ